MPDDTLPPAGDQPTESLGKGDQSNSSTPMEQLGDFELLREIGRGGMGVVYEARQTSLNRRVALKVLPPGLGLTSEAVKRFHREAQAAAKLHHTNIVPVYAIGEADNCHYYAMELVEGQPLSEVLRDLTGSGSNPIMDATVTKLTDGEDRGESAPASDQSSPSLGTSGITSRSNSSTGSRKWFDAVAKLVAEVADALEYAHGRGVIHRDIKPANLMLSGDGRLCITDFGLARVAQEPGMTVSGSLMGTPAYMSPEQVASGRMKLDHRTDVYSLGAVLYEMLTHRRPFPGESREEILGGILTKDPRPPRRFNPRIPVDLETICQKAMEKDPDKRYATAGDLAEDLRRYLSHGLIQARRAGIAKRTWKSIRRHPVVAITVIFAVLLVAAGGLTLRFLRQKAAAEIEGTLAVVRNHINSGEYAIALEKAEAVYDDHPELAEARLLRGYALIMLGRLSEAVEQARSRLEVDPNDWAAHQVLAHAGLKGTFRDNEQLDISVDEHLRAVEALAPLSADVLYLRTLNEGGESRVRLELLNKALELNPAHADALVLRINAEVMHGDFEAALLDCERLAAVRPRSAQGRGLKAYVYQRMGELNRALTEVNKALGIEPDLGSAYKRRATILSFLGRHEESLADWNRAIDLEVRGGWYLTNRSVIQETIGRYDEAIADSREAVRTDPNNLESYARLLDLYRRFGRERELQETLGQLTRLAGDLTRAPVRAEAHRVIGYHGHEKDGRFELALHEYTKAIEVDPGHEGAHILRGRLLLKLGRVEEALANFDQAVKVKPEAESPYRARGWAFKSLRRYPESLADLSTAIDHNRSGFGLVAREEREFFLSRSSLAYSGYEEAYLARACLLSALGRIEEAEVDYAKAIEVKPRSDAAYLLRGLANFHLGRVEQARADFEKSVEFGPANPWSYWGRALGFMFQPTSCDRVKADLETALELGRSEPQLWSTVAWSHAAFTWGLCPADYDPEFTLDLARRAVNDHQSAVERYGALGLALYRSALHQEAKVALERAMALPGEELAPDELLLAMVLWRLGENLAARAHYDHAVADWPYPEDPGYCLLRDEAAQFLGIEP